MPHTKEPFTLLRGERIGRVVTQEGNPPKDEATMMNSHSIKVLGFLTAFCGFVMTCVTMGRMWEFVDVEREASNDQFSGTPDALGWIIYRHDVLVYGVICLIGLAVWGVGAYCFRFVSVHPHIIPPVLNARRRSAQ